MATTEQNRQLYQHDYAWADAGEEWSWPWGGSDMQWYGTWLPRLRGFLPAATVLEIGCGYGRWSAFLRPRAEQLILVDVAERYVTACQQRFQDDDNVRCISNDGRSLDAIDDASVDFACSFDSLVHVDMAVLGGYIDQLGAKLTANGVAFLHHSNLAGCHDDPRLADEPMLHDRDPSVSAVQVRERAAIAKLACTSQELLNWGTKAVLIDTFSILTRPGSIWDQPYRQLQNPDFMAEVEHCGRLAALYSNRREAAAPVTW